ncbi:acetolactate synthase large subunit [Mangrovimicrobium sediminis]|uniref:Acetolactate synthase large subunit n=1 Tax=Mangrovimicrobium sediminis TaxID=2562682 RepID=A0A4Z0M1Z4_9GAMM|nr:acetolactate synthase large subunit [Haliea sp. SAOS-164]TGD73561.1 acetolactate synthase large subunit [Haliea sp. SAOS-164]
MNGAQSLIQTLVDSGVDVCFTNPGTSEMHFVAALDEVPGMRCVLCLFEGVVSGAALGYAAMRGSPAATLLHLGPGLGNAVANLHNAKKAHLPVVNIVGDHATYHLEYDAPLTSDIAGIAAPVSHWVHRSASSSAIAGDAAEAVREAGNSRIATLILPADVSWGDNPDGPAQPLSASLPVAAPAARIDAAARLLGNGKRTVILAGGRELSAQQGELLGRIAAVSGARLMSETFTARVRRGAGSVRIDKLPYLAEFAIEELKSVEQLILVGCPAPVSFFAYPGVPSLLAPDGCEVFSLAGPEEDVESTLQALVMQLGAADAEPERYPLQRGTPPSGALDANSVAQALACHLPEDAIVVDEGITSGMACYPATATAPAHDWLSEAGGSIGYGLPVAVGAAIACPQRKVICLEGDGSAMYTVQSLWTMAREQLDIVVVLFNNRKYSILELEFARTGARGGRPGPKAASVLDLGAPDLDFTALAQGMGVPASVAETAEAFSEQLRDALAAPGPHLIDARIPALELG